MRSEELGLTLQAADGDALDEVALGDEEDEDDGHPLASITFLRLLSMEWLCHA